MALTLDANSADAQKLASDLDSRISKSQAANPGTNYNTGTPAPAPATNPITPTKEIGGIKQYYNETTKSYQSNDPGAANYNSGYYSRLPDSKDSSLPSGATQGEVDEASAAKYKTEDPNQAAADFRTSSLKGAQSTIDLVNEEYAKKLQSELGKQAPVNENSLGRTNALSSLMGLAGSSSADARTSKTTQDNENINQGITDKVMAQKMERLGKIYDNIDAGAQKMSEAQLATNKENQKALLDDVSKNALSNLTAIATQMAGTGKTFDDWKTSDNGDALNKIMAQTGQSEYQLRNSWKNSIPENLRSTTHTSYIDDGKGGTIMRQVDFDPVSKKATSNDYNLAVPVSTFNGDTKPIEGKNGELFVKQADGTYKDVSPNADLNRAAVKAAASKFVPATKYQAAGFQIGDKFVPLAATPASHPGAGNLSVGTGFDALLKSVEKNIGKPLTADEQINLKDQYAQSRIAAFDPLVRGLIPVEKGGTGLQDYSNLTAKQKDDPKIINQIDEAAKLGLIPPNLSLRKEARLEKQATLSEANKVLTMNNFKQDPRVQGYRNASANITRVENAANEYKKLDSSGGYKVGNAPTDLDLVDGYIKMATGNAVTETQVDAIKNFQSLTGRVLNLDSKAQYGGFLTPDSRQQIIDLSRGLLKTTKQTADDASSDYQRKMDASGVDYKMTPDSMASMYDYTDTGTGSTGNTLTTAPDGTQIIITD